MKALNRSAFFERRPAIAGLAREGEDAGVFVKMLDAPGRERFEAFIKDPPKGIAKRAIFALLVACDEAGKPLFIDDDLPALSAGEWKSLDAILDAGAKLNGLGESEEQELKKSS
jgi:hypothetical protein